MLCTPFRYAEAIQVTTRPVFPQNTLSRFSSNPTSTRKLAGIASALMLPLTIGFSGCGGSSTATPTPPTQPTQTADTRATALEATMTQAEKLQLVEGGVTSNLTYGYTVPLGAGGYVPGVSSLGIPELYLADGSVGVGNGVGPATALPSSIASAASHG